MRPRRRALAEACNAATAPSGATEAAPAADGVEDSTTPSLLAAKQQLGGGRAKEVALGRRLRAALAGCERDEAHLDGAWARPVALTRDL